MNWPDATNSSADSNYEPAGPQVFRMEYYYVLKGQTSPAGTVFASELSDVPWEMRPDKNGLAYHTSVNGLQDVAAITVVIAVADPKTLALVNTTQLANLSGALVDFPATSSTGVNTTQSGSLQYLWQQTINTTNLVPRAAASSLRIYQRTFYLPSYPPSTH